MRASATSRTVSPASLPAPQAKSNASQADETSPFALLLTSTAPARPAKPSRKEAQDSNDKAADQVSTAKQDNSSGAVQTPAQPSGRPETKTDKADKSVDQATTTTGSPADGSQNAAIDQQLAGLQAVTPAPSLQTQADAADNDGDGLALDKIASATRAGTSSSGIPADAGIADSPATKPSNTAAAQAASAEQADDGQTDDAELQLSAAALPAQPGTKSSTDKTAQSVIAASGGQGAGSAGTTQAGTTADNIAANGTTASNTAQDSVGQSSVGKDASHGVATAKADAAKSDIAKNDVNKSGAARTRSVQNSNADDKADTNNTDDVAEPRTSPNPAILDSVQAAPKSAPPPIQSANAGFDISGGTGPQQPGQAFETAGVQQNVQVSAQPAPNLPALAVEIAARSQSGAKQFDIRLDPPELGRVDVRLSIDASGKASAHLSADQPRTLSLLQNDAPALTRALRDAGLDVSQDGLNFSLRQQAENHGGNTGENSNRGNSRAFSLTATADIDAAATSAAYRGVANGRLDIRV